MNDTTTIDIERLRNDLRSDSLGAYFGGGFGAALIDSFDVDNASPKELIDIARSRGFNLSNYEVY